MTNKEKQEMAKFFLKALGEANGKLIGHIETMKKNFRDLISDYILDKEFHNFDSEMVSDFKLEKVSFVNQKKVQATIFLIQPNGQVINCPIELNIGLGNIIMYIRKFGYTLAFTVADEDAIIFRAIKEEVNSEENLNNLFPLSA